MSWTYSYYLCYKNKEDGKLYPFGPFNYKHEFRNVVDYSRNNRSTLHEEFWELKDGEKRKELISPELFYAIHGCLGEDNLKEFYEGKGYYVTYYCKLDELPTGDYVKKGYCLLSDIEQYEDPEAWFDGFYDVLTPDMYARKLENELKFGKPTPEKDIDGYDCIPHSVADYSFYVWADYESKEYHACKIREAYRKLKSYKDDEEIYVVLIQG